MSMYEGTIERIVVDRGFGFIAVPNSPDCFFHFRDLIGLEFDERLQGQRVRFQIETGEKGLKAVVVQAAD